MKLEVSVKLKPISVLGKLFPEVAPSMKDYEVKINGELCPPALRDIIIMGLAYQSGMVGKTFSQLLDEYEISR